MRVAVLAAGRLALLHLLERDGLVLRLLRLDVLDPRVPDRAEEDDRDRRGAAPRRIRAPSEYGELLGEEGGKRRTG